MEACTTCVPYKVALAGIKIIDLSCFPAHRLEQINDRIDFGIKRF